MPKSKPLKLSTKQLLVFDERIEAQFDAISTKAIAEMLRKTDLKPKRQSLRRKKQKLRKKLRRNLSNYLDTKEKNRHNPEIIDKTSMTEVVVKSPSRRIYRVKTFELNRVLNNSVYARKAKVDRKRNISCTKCNRYRDTCKCINLSGTEPTQENQTVKEHETREIQVSESEPGSNQLMAQFTPLEPI